MVFFFQFPQVQNRSCDLAPTEHEIYLFLNLSCLWKLSLFIFVVTFTVEASTWSRSLKFILCLSLSSSACSGTDIWVMYRAWGKLWGVLVFRRPIPGEDSGDISLVSLVSVSPPSFFLFFSDDLFAFFCWLPQSLRQRKWKEVVVIFTFCLCG